MLTPIPRKSSYISTIKTKENSVFLYSEQGVLRIAVYEPAAFRISFNENDTFSTEQGSEFAGSSASTKDFSVKEDDDYISVKTSSLLCKVSRTTSSVNFFDLEGNILFSEATEGSHVLEKFDVYKSRGNIKTEEVKTADGVKKRVIAADKIFDKTLFHTKLNFSFAQDEKLLDRQKKESGIFVVQRNILIRQIKKLQFHF